MLDFFFPVADFPLCFLVGTTKVKNLDDNIGSLKVRLTKEDVKEISDMIPLDAAAGNNVPEIFIPCSWKFADTPQRDGGRPS